MTPLIIILVAAILITLISFESGWNNLLSGVRNSLVFEEKNKEYGAYKLRKGYAKVLAISLFSTIVVASSVIITPVILAQQEEEVAEVEVEVNVEMLAPPPTDPNEPPPPPPPIRQMQFTTIEVTEEEVLDPPPAVDDLQNQNIGNEDVEGEDGIQAPSEPSAPAVIEEVEEEIVAFVQEEPSYPGGIEKLYEEIYKSITYPEMEKENNIQGTVYISFVVEKTGAITDIKIERGVNNGPNLGKEAEKAVRKLKPFSPAKMNGKSVRYRYRMPIKFTLK
jgi:protein TonB